MRITLTCPQHGDWHPDLASHRSRSTCPAPGCRYRGVPRAAQFRPAGAPAAPAAARDDAPVHLDADNGVRLADVEAALAPLPRPHRAMVLLLLSAAAGRRHLRTARPSGHLGGIAAGDTGTGKTFIAVAVCQALGLPPRERLAGQESDRSLWGRRISEPGGAWRFVPADVLSQPFVALGELDKATAALRDAALRLLQGQASVPAEGQAVDIACTAYVSSNGPLREIPDAYQRRCAVLDLSGCPPLPREAAERVIAAIPRLPYELLLPPAAALPAEALAAMRDLLRLCLTPAGAALYDERALELAALARAGLAGGGDLTRAAVLTAAGYLDCAATVTGRVYPDYEARADRWLSGEPDPEPAPAPAPPAPAEDYVDRIAIQISADTLARKLARAARELAAVLAGAPAASQDHGAALIDAARDVGADLRAAASHRDRAALDRAAPAAGKLTEILGSLAGQIRGYSAALGAAARARESAAAMDAERDRRLAIHARAAREPAAIAAARPALPAAPARAPLDLAAITARVEHRRTGAAAPASPPPPAAPAHHRPYRPHLGTAARPASAGLLALAERARARNAQEAAVLSDLAGQGATAADMMRALGIIGPPSA